MRVADVIAFLHDFAPTWLAEDWDNVGLLIGDVQADVASVMTCLTLTPDVAAEAVERSAQLIVTHHPVLFRPVQRLTGDTLEGRMLLKLIGAGVAVYSPHTGYDSAADGINQQLAELLELSNVEVLRPRVVAPQPGHDTVPAASADDIEATAVGAGRFGDLAETMTLAELIERIKQRLRISSVQFVGEPTRPVQRVAIACGAAAEFLRDASEHACDVLLTGEARFHACLEAQSLNVAMILPGHYATERPAMERLAEVLSQQFAELTVWASRSETDPVRWA